MGLIRRLQPASEAAVAKIFCVARKIISKIRKSNLLLQALEDRLRAIGLPMLKLVLDVRTRWNSTIDRVPNRPSGPWSFWGPGSPSGEGRHTKCLGRLGGDYFSRRPIISDHSQRHFVWLHKTI
jgi:hypothetical protein